MNRKQRRSAKHRSPQLNARAVYEQKLRAELLKTGIRLVSAEVGTDQNNKPLWVLLIREGGREIVLSAKPQSVLQMAAAIRDRLSMPLEESKDEPIQAQHPAPPAVGPDARDTDPYAALLEGDGGALGALIPGGGQ